MADKPLYLQGRGRGRGRGGPASPKKNISPGHSVKPSSQANDYGRQPGKSAQKRFEDAALEHKDALERHLVPSGDNDYESSEDEEENSINDDEILTSMLKSFGGNNDGAVDDLGLTHEYLINAMKSGSNVCLICIETIKRTEAAWSCECCYCMFHINCIQKWVKDGVYQHTALSEENFPKRDIPWHCPKCRYEYKQSQCPTKYLCFCGKEEEPTFDPWRVPHSCDKTCNKPLKPECGHRCLLPCHPGPCPPCPKTVKVSCHCNNSSPQIRRCGTREWSCGKACGVILACGEHSCKLTCHEGECPACPETSVQPCQCGRNSSVRPCASPVWQCKEVCETVLQCASHTCEEICHSGKCGPCPRSGERTCPCGKTKANLPCTEDIPTCGDTCEKELECKIHMCSERCHIGPCGQCRQLCMKKCRCGQRSKEIPCYKEYLCETKCTRMKDCGKHQCRRKCCDKNCPSCEQECGKTLGCRNHKCSSRCHTGPCYPCPLTVPVTCNCGASKVIVPCGRDKVTRPPRCKLPCKIPPDCHHPTRIEHRCHFNRCPPCRQVCGKNHEKCSHTCPAICHSAVLTKVQQGKTKFPWEARPEVKLEQKNFECPPCLVPVPVTCLGEHETVNIPCWTARVQSCGRECKRLLPCGNHSCSLECHKVLQAVSSDQAGTNCSQCEEPCEKARAKGCSHPCVLACHPDECPSCKQMIRMRCHCQLVVQYVECYKWTRAGQREKDHLKACPSQCPKMLRCGHQCTAICHPGSCPGAETCSKKMTVKCPCKFIKKEFPCHEVIEKKIVLQCDEVCKMTREKQRQSKDDKDKQKQEEDLKRQQEELEEFERKLKKPKRKPRKQRVVEEEPSFIQRFWKVGLSILVLLVAIITYLIIYAM